MKKITVYTMDHCPYCERVKKLFQSRGYSFQEIKLDMNDDKAWEELENRTKYKTMPQVFIGEEFFGGFSDISELDQKGQLKSIIEGA